MNPVWRTTWSAVGVSLVLVGLMLIAGFIASLGRPASAQPATPRWQEYPVSINSSNFGGGSYDEAAS